jgi:hypothetical protein
VWTTASNSFVYKESKNRVSKQLKAAAEELKGWEGLQIHEAVSTGNAHLRVRFPEATLPGGDPVYAFITRRSAGGGLRIYDQGTLLDWITYHNLFWTFFKNQRMYRKMAASVGAKLAVPKGTRLDNPASWMEGVYSVSPVEPGEVEEKLSMWLIGYMEIADDVSKAKFGSDRTFTSRSGEPRALLTEPFAYSELEEIPI